MPKYNLFYNLLICSTNAVFGSVWWNVKKWGMCGEDWGIIPQSSFLLDIV